MKHNPVAKNCRRFNKAVVMTDRKKRPVVGTGSIREVFDMEELNRERMVRSATAGSAGEKYCSMILEAIGLIDGSNWSLEELEELWEDAARSPESVAEFIERRRITAP